MFIRVDIQALVSSVALIEEVTPASSSIEPIIKNVATVVKDVPYKAYIESVTSTKAQVETQGVLV